MGGGGGGWGGVGGGEDSFSLVFENSIVLIKCTLYDTVFQRQVSICRGVVFSYSFSIYCAAYHGIWCSEWVKNIKDPLFIWVRDYGMNLIKLHRIYHANIPLKEKLTLCIRNTVL